MKNALILHGTDDNSKENWFPWLENELIKKGYKVWAPDLPRANKPNITRYNRFIFSKWKFDKDSLIIGHSSGAVAILGILNTLPNEIAIDTAILVAGFTDDLGWQPLKELFLIPFDWNKIKTKAKRFILYHSDDDPYVARNHGDKLKDLLGAKLYVMSKQGHFSISTKGEQYKTFPELLKQIDD